MKYVQLVYFFCSFIYSQNNEFISVKYEFKYHDVNLKSDPNYSEASEQVKNALKGILKSTKFYESNLKLNLYYNNGIAVSLIREKEMAPEYFTDLEKALFLSKQDENWYIDLNDSLIISNKQLDGKKYNVKFTYPDWEITNETIEISGYKCLKAILKTNKSIQVWFTPDLNFQVGPYGVVGLPGLVLQYDSGGLSLNCNEISFKSFDTAILKKPNGIDITEVEFKKRQMQARLNRQ